MGHWDGVYYCSMDIMESNIALAEQIRQKQAEILHYEGVLERYGSGRWMDMGRRHLAELREQLAVLQQQSVSSSPVSTG